MKIHLIFAPATYQLNHGDLGKGIDPPLGILYMTSYLREYGSGTHDIKITDGFLEGYDKTLESARNEKADLIGISAVTSNIVGAYKLINELKAELPDSKIILGGPHPTALPEEAFENSNPDAVVIGEGEVTFKELVSYYAGSDDAPDDISGIDGLCISSDGKTTRTKPREFIRDLDTIPLPARELIDMKAYTGYPLYKASPSTTILSSRGCPFRCTFCSDNVWRTSSPAYRVRSPKSIADELQELKEKWGYREFFDNSDEFNTKLEYSKDVLREIISRNLNIHLKCQLRAKPIDEEFVQLMKQAGIWYIHLGIESGNDETIRGIKKMVTHAEVENCCRLLKKYDIKIWGLFMYFNIWEKDGKVICEDYDKSMNTFTYAKKLIKTKMIDYFGGTITTPYPGSELWNIAVKHNLIKEECKGQYNSWFFKRDLKLISHYPGVPELDIFKLHQKTVKHTMLALLLSGSVRLGSLPFLFLRSLYYMKRYVLLFTNKLFKKPQSQ